ncbi:winged helix-turn-helix domain-containing protein [Actinoplanes couchii]|uniref:Winged helix-turn-helix domain-containing protein n=1 Tax=Actinoplanes couchii TaxID=403638 RepID=A0ABQ3X8J9_9ACTN|nr:crosslink repair DNA glycosylase YcaQ family protein [Actinoplanes couchii]MDR6320156.1 uncharacterized protein YcaQ [Actinoplanes couchii]GID54830.1 hypothetical protein Aco03nite_032340 [Actinoplanes couchii]
MVGALRTTSELSPRAVRRFVLGRQGLWPGRRVAAADGVRSALTEAGMIQIDPLTVLARSHDLALHGRVLDYRPADLDRLMYTGREFFDYGGTLFVVPMTELPYWRTPMARRAGDERWRVFAAEHPALLDDVRSRLRDEGPLSSRDFGGAGKRGSFRSAKQSANALYYLWLTGELMTHGRRRFERLYGFRDDIAPAGLRHAAPVEDAERYFAGKAFAVIGLATARSWAHRFARLCHRKVDRDEARSRIAAMVDRGEVTPVRVAHSSVVHYVRTEDLPLLEVVARGGVPEAWRPLGPDTTAEVTFLAPLDIVSARGRARELFGFEYLWEVYKPAERRRWGYYTMPVLHGDELVARIDPKLDRETGTLRIEGLWFEDDATARDGDFLDAYAAGLNRLAETFGATRVTGRVPGPNLL